MVQLGAPGRPRNSYEGSVVDTIVVVREQHANGEFHFHWAVRLKKQMRFMPAKRTLRDRYKICSHWSCTHTQWWSALRYLVKATPKKPLVDAERYVWTHDGREIDVYHECQESWIAKAWKRRREQKELADPNLAKKARFTKLDLTAVILDKKLTTKTQLLEFTQDHGSASMQHFVHQWQKKLKELMEEAKEWGNAREAAKAERESDWELVVRFATTPCKIGAQCNYRVAADRIFRANERHGLCKRKLAVALRDIIKNGPSKTTRVPLLVGPTNTGKTTLIAPFDKVFGFCRVFHKPALGSKYALRNLLKDKRFLMWDDYRPVEYGAETVPVNTFLSLFTGQPFEVQMSQSFNDGNEDFEWRRGCVMTAKEKDLWQPKGEVDSEDVEHMKTRCEMFPCKAKVRDLKDTSCCPHCMCKWIVEAAAAHDESQVVAAVPSRPEAQGVADALGAGLEALGRAARLPQRMVDDLRSNLLTMGAVDVGELTLSDWQSCAAFASARPLEQRRLLSNLPVPPQF